MSQITTHSSSVFRYNSKVNKMRGLLFLWAVTASLSLTFPAAIQASCDGCDDGCAACLTGPCSASACQAAGRCCGGPRCVGKAELVDVGETAVSLVGLTVELKIRSLDSCGCLGGHCVLICITVATKEGSWIKLATV